jgi:hypothetical protein
MCTTQLLLGASSGKTLKSLTFPTINITQIKCMEFLTKITKNKERKKKLYWLADHWLGNPV